MPPIGLRGGGVVCMDVMQSILPRDEQARTHDRKRRHPGLDADAEAR